MENVIIYGIVAVIIIVNIIRTYQKEAKKNKERVFTQPIHPATSSVPPPFSRSQRVNETSRNTEYIEVSQNMPSMKSGYNYTEEGVSAIQKYIDTQSKFKDDEHFLKEEDVVSESFDLKLDTAEDFKRAFVHTLIFERKF
ncbi:hypothetical protein [Dysgonomonas alginatilytica]|nr:hypothetical protein [Dysgonomonas alginatilytica]